MAAISTLYVVTVSRNSGSGSRMWFFDRDEAEDLYESAVDELGDEAVVTLYVTDVQQIINDHLDEAVQSAGNSNSTLQELRSSRPADDITWSDLSYHPAGHFTIERLKASSSEHWAFHVEPYNVEGSQAPAAWRVIDSLSDVPMAIIRHQENDFKVTINGYSQTETFRDLKAAVIYSVGEFNG